MRIVTIMNYKRDPRYDLMCYTWFKQVIAHGATEIIVFYENNKPIVHKSFENRPGVKISLRAQKSVKGYDEHHNIRFKLPVLGQLNQPFIFLDSDMYVIADLHPLWELRKDKPWIGTNHQRIKSLPDTMRKPFLNSGLQIVGDPKFYDWQAMLNLHKKLGSRFIVPGRDQSVIYRYFKHIEYDYTHPKVTTAWNSCSYVGRITKENGKWVGRTNGLDKNHPIYINHYWHVHKPWKLQCPIHVATRPEFRKLYPNSVPKKS